MRCPLQLSVWRHTLRHRLLHKSTASGHTLSLLQRWPTFCPFLANEGKRRSGLLEEDVGGVDVDLAVSNTERGTFRAALKESFFVMHSPSCCFQPVCCYFWSVEKFLWKYLKSHYAALVMYQACPRSSKQTNKQNSHFFHYISSLFNVRKGWNYKTLFASILKKS